MTKQINKFLQNIDSGNYPKESVHWDDVRLAAEAYNKVISDASSSKEEINAAYNKLYNILNPSFLSSPMSSGYTIQTRLIFQDVIANRAYLNPSLSAQDIVDCFGLRQGCQRGLIKHKVCLLIQPSRRISANDRSVQNHDFG